MALLSFAIGRSEAKAGASALLRSCGIIGGGYVKWVGESI